MADGTTADDTPPTTRVLRKLNPLVAPSSKLTFTNYSPSETENVANGRYITNKDTNRAGKFLEKNVLIPLGLQQHMSALQW